MLPHTLPSRLATEDDYINYWENVAYSMVDIKHSEDTKRFYRRVDDYLGVNVKYPMMAVFPQPLDYPGEWDAMFEVHSFQVLVMDALGTGDAAKQKLLVNKCKLIADEIIGKLRQDSEQPGSPITYFQLQSSEPIDDPYTIDKGVGWEFVVSIGNQKQFIYNPEKWR